MMDRLALLASVAPAHGRTALKLLDEPVQPMLAPIHRGLAQHLGQRIARREILDERFLSDLDALIVSLQQLVAEGTSLVWEPDDYDTSGGREMFCRDDRAAALGPVVDELKKLWGAVAETLDAAKAVAGRGPRPIAGSWRRMPRCVALFLRLTLSGNGSAASSSHDLHFPASLAGPTSVQR